MYHLPSLCHPCLPILLTCVTIHLWSGSRDMEYLKDPCIVFWWKVLNKHSNRSSKWIITPKYTTPFPMDSRRIWNSPASSLANLIARLLVGPFLHIQNIFPTMLWWLRWPIWTTGLQRADLRSWRKVLSVFSCVVLSLLSNSPKLLWATRQMIKMAKLKDQIKVLKEFARAAFEFLILFLVGSIQKF